MPGHQLLSRIEKDCQLLNLRIPGQEGFSIKDLGGASADATGLSFRTYGLEFCRRTVKAHLESHFEHQAIL